MEILVNSKQVVQEKIIKILADVLQRSSSEINPRMTLFGEIEIESVEILEIAFVLEQEFGIKIGPYDLWNISNQIMENGWFVDRQFTSEAIHEICKTFKSLTEQDVKNINSINTLIQHLTINDLVEFVCEKTKQNRAEA